MTKFGLARALAALGFGLALFGAGCATKQPGNIDADGGGVWNPPEIPPDLAGIDVFSDPASADVVCTDMVTGARLEGQTPFRFLVTPNRTYEIVVTKPDFMTPEPQRVTPVETGTAVEVTFDLAPMPHGECCEVHVSSSVDGASVYVDRAPNGKTTPATFRLEAGHHRITAGLEGFITPDFTVWEENLDAEQSIEVYLARDLAGIWDPEGDTPGGPVEIVMEINEDSVAAHLVDFIALGVIGNGVSYDDGTRRGTGEVSEDGSRLHFTLTNGAETTEYNFLRR